MKKFFTLLAVASLFGGVVNAEPVTTSVGMRAYDYDDDSIKADYFYTTLSYEDGVYTIEDFYGCEVPVSFTIPEVDTLTANAYNNGVTFVGDNFDKDGSDWYLQNNELFAELGDDYYCYFDLYNFGDEEVKTIWWPSLYVANKYQKVYYKPAASNGKTLCLSMTVAGYDDDDNDVWLVVTMWFPDLAAQYNGVEINSENEAAPAYYNLQGVKVANPEKGIFIKKVGGKAVKFML